MERGKERWFWASVLPCISFFFFFQTIYLFGLTSLQQFVTHLFNLSFKHTKKKTTFENFALQKKGKKYELNINFPYLKKKKWANLSRSYLSFDNTDAKTQKNFKNRKKKTKFCWQTESIVELIISKKHKLFYFLHTSISKAFNSILPLIIHGIHKLRILLLENFKHYDQWILVCVHC